MQAPRGWVCWQPGSFIGLLEKLRIAQFFNPESRACPGPGSRGRTGVLRRTEPRPPSLRAIPHGRLSPMSAIPPDPASYTRPPVMTIEGGITLCRVLAESCPKTMPASVKKAQKRLVDVAEAAQVAYTLRKKSLGRGGEEDSRPVDRAGDNSWGALRGRLQAYALLPAETYPDARRAAEILASLFGEAGLSFLTESYPEQYAIADSVLRRIDEEAFAIDIDRIAGKEFLENVRTQHVAYGKMVAGVLQRETALSEDLGEHVRAMGQEIVDYATKVLATVERDKPATITATRLALRPLDAFREATQKRPRSSGDAAGDPPASPEGA